MNGTHNENTAVLCNALEEPARNNTVGLNVFNSGIKYTEKGFGAA